MPIRQTLSAVLRGELAADLTPEARDRLEALAREAQSEGDAVFVRDECAARLRQPNPSHGVEYLLAEACMLNGEIERAHQTLLGLGDKLAAARSWEPLAALAERVLDFSETQAAARLLVKAHEGLGRDPDRIQALERARHVLRDDLELGLLLAVRLGEAGQIEQRRALLVELLPSFAAAGRYAGLEEAALEFVENRYHDGLIGLFETLPTVAEQGAHHESRQLFEIAFPAVAQAGRAGECLDVLRTIAVLASRQEGSAAGEPYRAAILESLRQGPARELPDPKPVFRLSGLEDATQRLEASLERYDAIAALPPGGAVHHASFGAGRVISNDSETVTLDFAHASGHKMPLAAARRTLARIAEDDVRLLKVIRPDELNRLRSDEPAEVLCRALKSMGGAADAQRLKVFLVGSGIVPANEWTTFWRRARTAANRDTRIDASRAFEQHYRLAAEGEPTQAAEAPLPALEPRRSVRSNLGTLRKFLQQHPQSEPALARRFGKYVERALSDEEGDRADRARAGLFFSRWFPERLGDWVEVLKLLWEQGLKISDLAGEDEQIALLEASHAAGVESDAILSALDSRFSAVREEAQHLREQLNARGREDLRRTLLYHAARYPTAALRLIEDELARGTAPDGWRILWAGLSLIQDRPKPSIADKMLRRLQRGGGFENLLSGLDCPEDLRTLIQRQLKEWRSSDRLLFPALEAVERLGLAKEVEAVRTLRQQRAEKLFDRVGQQAPDSDLAVMTRATWELLQKELERLERELRTTIPAAIQKARELGDLRENAEYHSAKLKQANVSRLVRSLQMRLSRARFVDHAEYKDGVVGLGTEVVLESVDEVVTYWILGEGEHHHGDHVVSFQAPVGRALMGRSIGEEVELGDADRQRRYRVVSVERKLPPPESQSEN